MAGRADDGRVAAAMAAVRAMGDPAFEVGRGRPVVLCRGVGEFVVAAEDDGALRAVGAIYGGTTVRQAAAAAARIALAAGARTSFEFNGATAEAAPGDDPELLYGRWRAEKQRLDDAHRASPEGRRAEEERAERRRAKQARHDACMRTLPEAVGDLTATVRWLVEYMDCSNSVGVRADFGAVVRQLEAAGHRRCYSDARTADELEDPQILGEYLVGRAISEMRGGWPPHRETTETLAGRYFERLGGGPRP